jgi:CubicO group peptidase (beta-lactamase class C family)
MLPTRTLPLELADGCHCARPILRSAGASRFCAALAASLFCISAASAAPDEELLGKSKGYPIGTRATWFMDETVRVGAFSNLDKLFPHRVLHKAANPSPLRLAAVEPALRYSFGGRTHTIDDYLAHQRTTGLLVIKDGEVLVQRYQYDRTATDRFLSNSMAKSLVSIAMGLALSEKHIRSLDDKVVEYVPELKGNVYGETAIRNLLRMASGVRFTEDYDGRDDLAKFSRLQATKGSIPGLLAFNGREVPEGERFHYASIETQVLAVVLCAATGKTLSGYLSEKLWQPMGAEADATWIIAPDGLERAAGNFNATLRDWGRLGLLLANDGVLDGKQIIPRDYLLEATDWHKHPAAFAPRRATKSYGYGYQFWTLPGEKRRFVLLGVYGQAIYVDPELKLVLVHTAVAKTARVGNEPMGAELSALWVGLVNTFGHW